MGRILISLTLVSNGYIIQTFFSHEPSNCRSNVHKLFFFMSPSLIKRGMETASNRSWVGSIPRSCHKLLKNDLPCGLTCRSQYIRGRSQSSFNVPVRTRRTSPSSPLVLLLLPS
ncbi:hypothetical protein BCR42DRAFT_425479 [Absidia repens]|uniref:Uncharacterized protein n=1 Tax=Absidia repens TaxID=90262 RepID=A0A1X2I2X0_9FUNG|nr:hypothetical protein BCR42DRAFT_425479 [Absidia repens]